jgi:hypothetical protein
MICGIDIFKGAGKKSIFGFTSTYNRTFTKYISIAKVYEDDKSCQVVNDCMEEAVQNVILLIFIYF